MNTEFPPEKKRSRKRPFLLTVLGLLIVFGFYFAVMNLCTHQLAGSGSGLVAGGGGHGSGDEGDGTGSGTGGTGTGGGHANAGIGSGDTEISGSGSELAGHDDKSGTPESSENPQEIAVQKKQSGTDADENTEGNTDLAPKQEFVGMVLSAPKEPTVLKKRESIFPEQKEPEPETAAVSAPEGNGQAAGGGSFGLAGKKGFFGMKITSNTVFVVDCSGSMSANTREEQRMNVLKNQLKNAIITSDAAKENGVHLKYCILAFGMESRDKSGLTRYFTVFPANGEMKKFNSELDPDADQFIQSMAPIGGTPILEAMRGVKELVSDRKTGIKTVYLLTDGEPTDGDWKQIINYIQKEIPKSIIFNCISIGRSCPEMQQLSRVRKGTYKEFL